MTQREIELIAAIGAKAEVTEEILKIIIDLLVDNGTLKKEDLEKMRDRFEALKKKGPN